MLTPANPVVKLLLLSPAANTKFEISADAKWPDLVFKTNAVLLATQRLTWTWKIQWGTFSKSGTTTTTNNSLDLKPLVNNLGGTLTVNVSGPFGAAGVTVRIVGKTPDAQAVKNYLATRPNSKGFERILEHETHMVHFNAGGEPVKSFDNGYGICQLTAPAPTYEQVWNWKLNIDAGLKLFETKRQAAVAHLSQSGRKYTSDQLVRETISRWNGSPYHVWDAKKGWVRPSNILCDRQTGNIGWDLNDPANSGKTEAQLRARDVGKYKTGKPEHWRYLGICYADSILG
jgi:hypothetical protein